MTGSQALARVRDQMRSCESGRAVLAERPRVTDATLNSCRLLPPGALLQQSHIAAADPRADTLGGAWCAFMAQRDFAPHARPPVRFVDDEELAYVACRLREVHDLWHVLFGCDTSVSGELALKAVEAVQTRLPSAALAAALAPLRLSAAQRAAYRRRALPWALRAGWTAVDLASLRYEQHFGEELALVRARWKISPFVGE